MQLALVIDDYLPHSTRVAAQMFHDLAVYLVSIGHSVTVITPQEGQKQKLCESELDGVKVWRFRSGEIKNTHKVKRAINESLLSIRAWNATSLRITPGTFDGVVYYSPSIFFGGLVSKIKNRCNCPSYLILRDLFPQWLIDAGIVKRGSLIEAYFRHFENYSYKQANVIGLMSENNQLVFDKLTNNSYKTEVLRNWSEITPYIPNTTYNRIRKELGLESKIIFFYGGNIGHAQDMSNLIRLAKEMKGCSESHFLFVGQGDEVELIQRLKYDWNLDNVTYLPSVSQSKYKAMLSEVDVGLFSLAANHTAHNFPGKLLGYMAQSIPILGSVNAGNDLMNIVNSANAGLITVNGEDEALARNARQMLKPSVRKALGNKANTLLKREFSVAMAAKNIILSLNNSNA